MLTGLDLGGTKIEAVLFDDSGAELFRDRRPTPRRNYKATLAAIRDLVAAADSVAGVTAPVGLGAPGAPDRRTGLIKNAYQTALNGKPLAADLSDVLGREVRLANDANCFALSEALDGAGAGSDVVFGVILGTGVGGGLVVNGRIVEGRNAIAGEWGHNALPWPDGTELQGHSYYTGGERDIEAFLSGAGLVADHARATGKRLSAPEIARADTPEKQATMIRYERRLAKALATIINVVDPDAIILGGGLSNIDSLYESVPRLWGEHVFSPQVETRLLKNMHGASSGVRGAAWLWRQR